MAATEKGADGVQSVRVRIERLENYRFEVDWGLPSAGPGTLDEPPPIGGGAGPGASRLVASAVAHCLSSSLLFCLARSRVPVQGIAAEATAEIRRNERGRWRLSHITVQLDPVLPPEAWEAFERCRQIFEDFCIVTESVRHGIPVDVVWKTSPSEARP
jgi:organic hydroperoxide reductase OsmC/OhrA